MYTVVVIDDSLVMRELISETINSTGDFRVIATAANAFDGRDKIKQYEPDLVTIDINMPKMDGVSFLKNLMRLHPMPAIVISSESYRGNDVFEYGAIGFVPKADTNTSIEQFKKNISNTLLSLAYFIQRYSKQKPIITQQIAQQQKKSSTDEIEQRFTADIVLPKKPAIMPGEKIIAIGSSTGGIETLIDIFGNLPAGLPPIVIVQHIPYGFSKSFADRLDRISPISVHEAVNGQILEKSNAYLAPGNMHMIISKNTNGDYVALLNDGQKVSRHKPSVDVLFRSVNNIAGSGAMGVILTGMGDDGASSMVELYENGALTVAQDKESCVVYGMPAKAVEYGGVREVVELKHIPARIIQFSTNGR